MGASKSTTYNDDDLLACDLRVFNLSGELVISRTMTPTGEWINISNLPKGIYQVHITGATGIWNGRLAKIN